MAIKDANRKARANYKKKIEMLRIELYPTDADIKAKIAERLEAGERKTTYIKRLVREDIERIKQREGEAEMKEIEILMEDGCTKAEAEKHLKNGTTVFSDFEKNFDYYVKEWDIPEEDIPLYRQMVEKKKPIPDWGIVEDGEKTYYINYVL